MIHALNRMLAVAGSVESMGQFTSHAACSHSLLAWYAFAHARPFTESSSSTQPAMLALTSPWPGTSMSAPYFAAVDGVRMHWKHALCAASAFVPCHALHD